jgi:predicted RND superfamily exporter protein
MMTTVGALMSFCFIALLPLRWLGLVSSALIFCAFLIVIVLNPVLLSFGKNRSPKKIIDRNKVQWTDSYFRKLGGWVYKNALPVMIVFLLVLGFFIWGLTKVEIGSDLKRTYGEKIPFIKRIMEITESEIGYFYSYNITLKFEEPDQIKDPQILKALEIYTQGIQARTDVRYVTSFLHIVKDMNQLFNENDPGYYTIPDDRNIIEQTLTLYEEHGDREIYTWVTEDYSALRLKVAVNDMNDTRMREDIKYVKNTAAQLFPDAEYIITGMIPTMVVINTNITEGLIKSLFIALGVILILLMIVFKSIKTGLIGLIPNITPVIIVGGVMGLLNIPLDFMTMTMLPMILGLAVDDTIHFITHANMEFNKLNDYQKAIKSTLSITGRALFMTSFIIVAAFAIYFTAEMQAQVNFGIFITLGISSALIADYLITPICLKWLKPFGKRNHKEERKDGSNPSE